MKTIKQFHFVGMLLFFLFAFSINVGYTNNVDTTQASISSKPAVEIKTDDTTTSKKVANGNTKTDKTKIEKRVMPVISELTIQIISILFFAVMLVLFFYFFRHIRENHQFLGFQSIKLIGLILMFPGICIIALVGNGLISDTTLAALFGTIAGYVLSKEDDSKKAEANKALVDLKKEKDDLEAKYKESEKKLAAEIVELRKHIP
jgi:hypothetical protein